MQKQTNEQKKQPGNASTAVKAVFIGCLSVSLMLMSCGNSGEASAPNEASATITESTEPAIDETHFKASDLVDLDLSSNGIPVITKAPKGAKVMKYEVDGGITVYGGKFFKITFSKTEGTVEENHTEMKEIVGNKELNTSFDKFEVEDKAGFVKKNTQGKLAFMHFLDAGGTTYQVVDGMPYDISPDKFSDYTPEDVKVMYEAAKATVAK